MVGLMRLAITSNWQARGQVLPHDQRLSSGNRGLTLAALEGIRVFYERHGGLGKTMGDVCKQEGFT